MIKKLRQKFIIISVGAVFIVVFVIAAFSNLFNYSQIITNTNELLTVLVENDGTFPKKPDRDFYDDLPPKMSPEAPFSTRFFTAKVDAWGNIFSVDTGKVTAASTEQALTYATEALESQKINGLIKDYQYRIAEKDDGLLIVFVDVGRDLDIFYSFLRNSIIIGTIAILAVFIIVLIFSKKAIAPIAETYEKQKQFITDAGHELKTPLTIINTNAEVLEMEAGESQWTKSIQHQVLRLSKLVENLVSLSRMDEGNNQLSKRDFSLSDLLLETTDQFQGLSKSYHKALLLDVKENISYYGHEPAFNQLISILIDNALKYSSTESVIEITLKREGKKYILQIINEAEDLTPGNYDHLFERFYRAESSRNSKLGGYGIGLSIAKAIVLKHKGKITAKSPDGKRIIFSIKL